MTYAGTSASRPIGPDPTPGAWHSYTEMARKFWLVMAAGLASWALIIAVLILVIGCAPAVDGVSIASTPADAQRVAEEWLGR